MLRRLSFLHLFSSIAPINRCPNCSCETVITRGARCTPESWIGRHIRVGRILELSEMIEQVKLFWKYSYVVSIETNRSFKRKFTFLRYCCFPNERWYQFTNVEILALRFIECLNTGNSEVFSKEMLLSRIIIPRWPRRKKWSASRETLSSALHKLILPSSRLDLFIRRASPFGSDRSTRSSKIVTLQLTS